MSSNKCKLLICYYLDVTRNLKAFKIKVNGKVLDYRVGRELNLAKIREYFSKEYEIRELMSAPRHVVGILQKKGGKNQKFFLKLSKSEGISATTQNEYKWNDSFNKNYKNLTKFRVPKNYESGYYEGLFYIIMEYFEGSLLCPFAGNGEIIFDYIKDTIELSEIIQKARIKNLRHNDFIEAKDYKEWFLDKTKAWLEGIPEKTSRQFELEKLLTLVEENYQTLEKRPRHGDFTPWHIIKLEKGGLGLIDGEHAISDSVAGYDICYFIQRVFSELKNAEIAQEIFNELLKRDYDPKKLRTVLTARAIGGYLDESLKPKPDYTYKNRFRDWVLKL